MTNNQLTDFQSTPIHNQNIHQILEKYWGYTSFRPLQEDIIKSVLNGKDTLALLPTGGGKSICFQVPALLKEGICIVVSPLIALMKDQVENLKKRGIDAVAVVSGISQRELDITLDNCIYGKTKFLYLSPERLKSELVQARIKKMKVNLLAVDEAHCISQWGYDFRPSYLQIADLRTLIPNTPVLALTATATKEVVQDIQEKLLFVSKNVVKGSFKRNNLSYSVLYEENKLNKLLRILNNVPGTGVVYVRNRKETKKISDFLTKNHISADYYHAGLSADERNEKQNSWTNNKVRVIVSTNAFGMGIDKPDVRSVVHIDLPDSPEAYFQEAGRAGRDGKKAYAVLLYQESDRIEFEKRFELAFPSIEILKRTYQALCNYFQIAEDVDDFRAFDFDLQDFISKHELGLLQTYNSIKLLEKHAILLYTENFYMPSRLMFLMNNVELNKFQISNQNYDNLIKLLLRSYEGLFDGHAKINEFEISKRLEIKKEFTLKMLNDLNREKVISYFPQNNLPKISFLTRRQPVEYLQIDKKQIEERKKVYKKKMDAMLSYSSKKNICRSTVLLDYFNEPEAAKCGKCDVCLGRNKMDMNDNEYRIIHDQIKKYLYNNNIALSSLVSKIEGFNENKALKTIRWMADNGLLKISNNDLVCMID